MTTFSHDPALFADHAHYVGLLKTAIKKVKPQPPIKFLYYKQHQFNGKKWPLLLLDHDAKLQAALVGKGQKATAEGLVSMTTKDELDFEVKHGTLKRTQLKRYLGTIPGMKEVFVPEGEVDGPDGDDDNEADGVQPVKATNGSGTAAQVKPTPPPKPQSLQPAQAQAQAHPQVQPQAQLQAQPKAPPPNPAELVKRINELKTRKLQPDAEAKKHDVLTKAVEHMKDHDYRGAAALLDALASKALPIPPPKPTMPSTSSTASVPKPVVANDGGDSDESAEDESEDDGSGEEPDLDSPVAKKAALSPTASVASAQKQLALEEEAFKRQKMLKKTEKIKASTTEQEKATLEQLAKAEKKAAEALEDKGRFDFLKFGKKDDKKAQAEKAEKTRIELTLANKKADDEIKKYVGKPIGIVALASKGETGLAKGIGKALDAGNTGDDIASAAGSVATSTAGVASSLVDAARAFRLYANTRGAERTVHLKDALAALGGAFGNLVNLTKGSLNVAQHAGALEAGSAVPILGIVAAIPTLLAEINAVRSAGIRLIKQEKVQLSIEKQAAKGDTSQETLATMVSGFIARDTDTVGKGIAKIVLDFTKIAGHGVSAGGITGPIGVALVAVGSAGKLVISGVGGVQDLVAANRANDRRKKLQPTLSSTRDWKGLKQDKPNAKETVELDAAIAALEKAEKGSPEHLAALEAVARTGAAYKKANAGQKKLDAYVTQLMEQALQEKADWQRKDEDEEDETQAQGQPAKGGTPDPQQRNARKLIKQDPQLAAQMLVEQALREGPPDGGPAFIVLKSFGIKSKQLYADLQGDDRIANLREIRQKVLYKLAADDDTAKTLSQTLTGAKDTVVDYFSMKSKDEEMTDYMEAKNLLEHGGKSDRGKDFRWKLKMNLMTDDIEEKKEALRVQVEQLVKDKNIEPGLARDVLLLLRTRQQKKGAQA